MNQIHHQRESSPGFGRVFATTVVSLGALVGIGLAFYAWNGSGSGSATTLDAADGTSVSGQTTGPNAAAPIAPFLGDGSSTIQESGLATSPSVRETDTAVRVLDAGRTADSGAGAPSSSASSDSVRPAIDPSSSAVTDEEIVESDHEDILDLSDIERPVAYADAEARFVAGDYDEARRYFAAYVEDHGTNAWGFYMLGLSSLKAGNPEAAEDAFLAALDLDPDHEKSLVNLARARMELADYSEALLPVERAREIAPENRDAARVYARALHNLGRSTDAADVYLDLLTWHPEDVWSMNNLGLIRIEKEEFTLAVPPLARAVEARLDRRRLPEQPRHRTRADRRLRGRVVRVRGALSLDAGYGRARENLDRVTALRPTQSREPLDLAVFAAAFVDELAGGVSGVGSLETVVVEEDAATTLPETEETSRRCRGGHSVASEVSELGGGFPPALGGWRRESSAALGLSRRSTRRSPFPASDRSTRLRRLWSTSFHKHGSKASRS
ncbi:MAG: tetratricopeptide repeat protein [Candidatus Eisenbacteria bacterium]